MIAVMRRRRFLAAAGAAWAVPACAAGGPARVAAASDLQFALPELAALFERTHAEPVTLNFGSSGNFARQLRQGAPVDLYLSADEAFVFQLADAGLTRDRGALYALGRIALLVPAASAIPLDAQLDGLRHMWAPAQRFAIANPEHAPYGRAAREALQAAGLWARLEPGLVLGENVSQATQFVSSGAAQAGITAASLALAPPVAAQTRHHLIAESLHRPLRQRMVLLKGARPAAVAFFDYLATPPARAILARYGFAAPPGPS
ncbi:molybdate ABC transporter substrate-binding protein [Piscinibacter sp.]|uniref:molybdate ABC transporter substrate-binding protein n=1 Tax=Piscinibacter sp. TaxID=1903157 RepID=UPI002CB31E30|nr:molybdate ABC transporter substrate-binding protein [Albitalea sp.]HUG22797.1 molybdate ABC transporter substrate-binding protein [Albitalea sp.]